MSYGIDKISYERQRQIEVEGYTAEHDDGHLASLGMAAQAYVRHAVGLEYGVDLTAEECGWPWAEQYWKPKTEEEDLIRAGALIAAALDALEREKEL